MLRIRQLCAQPNVGPHWRPCGLSVKLMTWPAWPGGGGGAGHPDPAAGAVGRGRGPPPWGLIIAATGTARAAAGLRLYRGTACVPAYAKYDMRLMRGIAALYNL